MPDYQKGKIYTIRCKKDNTLIYVGSTCETLCRRMAKHRHDWKVGRNPLFCAQIENFDDWYIELFEDFPCERKEELIKLEGELIREIGTLNQNIAGRTEKEWKEENKDRITETGKVYYQNNRDKIIEQHAEKITCECGCIATYGHLSRHKESKKHITLMKQKEIE